MDEELYEEESGGRKFHWLLPIIRILTFVAGFFNTITRLFAGFAEDLVEHVNYTIERDAFKAEARRDIEMITEGTEEE